MTASTPSAGVWPALPIDEWQGTRDTVHMWSQIVGKVRLALAPKENQWWNVALYVNGAGLTTSLMPYRGIGVEIAFDFVRHQLVFRTSDGRRRTMTLEPRSVADFFAEFRTHLKDLDLDVPIRPKPVEVPVAIPFTDDTEHASYDADAMHRFWISLVDAQRVMSRFRGEFHGKASPVHFFWGAFDLAATRFSGRPAVPHPGGIPNCPDFVMTEAYNEEVSSCGYWPGGADEGVFYSYAYPEPAGFRSYPLLPAGARYDEALAEYVLPYAAVRAADDPDAYLRQFLASTFDAASSLATWPSRAS